MASISYRIFNNEEQDEYPTFSICFGEGYGAIFNQSHDLFKSDNVTRESYYDYLMGRGKDYPTQSTTIEYDDVVLDIHEGYLHVPYGLHVPYDVVELDLVPTFRSPNKTCVSKTIVQRKNVKQQVDSIWIDSSTLYVDRVCWVEVYVHKKGQLIRDMATEGYRAIFFWNAFKNGAIRQIDIGQVDVLRKRADGKIPCDQDMQDEDEYRVAQIMKSVGCIPTFWRQHAVRMGLNQTYPICTNTMDYGKVQTQISNIYDNISILDITHKFHCTMMMASVTIRDETDLVVPGLLEINLNYHGTSYREIINTEAYTSETLLGQVGGFVGTQCQL